MVNLIIFAPGDPILNFMLNSHPCEHLTNGAVLSYIKRREIFNTIRYKIPRRVWKSSQKVKQNKLLRYVKLRVIF